MHYKFNWCSVSYLATLCWEELAKVRNLDCDVDLEKKRGTSPEKRPEIQMAVREQPGEGTGGWREPHSSPLPTPHQQVGMGGLLPLLEDSGVVLESAHVQHRGGRF